MFIIDSGVMERTFVPGLKRLICQARQLSCSLAASTSVWKGTRIYSHSTGAIGCNGQDLGSRRIKEEKCAPLVRHMKCTLDLIYIIFHA